MNNIQKSGNSPTIICNLKKQGLSPGSCLVKSDNKRALACQTTLKQENNKIHRMITSIHLSRPENYLSIYQSGCNFSCRKCHSWYFSKIREGRWYTPADVLKEALGYQQTVTLIEPKENITAWHARDSCRCCGSCVLYGKRSEACPGRLKPDAILLSPQGFGPARNIVAFTGGDLTCCPEFYSECARLIKAHLDLRVLIETNGFGLTPRNLDCLQQAGVDSFWLDIKAYDSQTHQWLTGCCADHILNLPEEILKRNFVLEVLSLFIPQVVGAGQLEKIALHLKNVDPAIPFTILAFFPEHRMKNYRAPTVTEMVEAYHRVRETGLQHIRLGNVGVFARSEKERRYLQTHVDENDF
ncbi:MAG: radical SAM protein [Desulfobacterales bacterium]|jgi:pyruvate-formate lyase-activating enzyme